MSDDDVDFTPQQFDPYQTLNVTPDATLEEIQESYKKLSRTFHPDRNAHLTNPNTLDASRQEFEAITKAKEILSNSQTRQAYDHFGLKGIEMMQRNLYNDIKSLQIGKKYRNDNAVQHLLKYYLKQEAKFELDKLLSTQGHCEVGIDATSLYQEFVDLIFRHETIPQFINNIKNGIPTLQIVLSEDEWDETVEYIEEEEDEMSMSELMTMSIEDQVSVIQSALNSGDMTFLKNIPVQRQSVSPELLSFLISIGFQYEYNDNNTLVLNMTQYNDGMNGMNNKLFQNINIELHQQWNRFLKFVYGISVGLEHMHSKFIITRSIDNKTSVDIGFYFNWLDVWNGGELDENAADLFGGIIKERDSNKSANMGYLNIIPELFTVFKNGVVWGWKFLRNMSLTIGGYPGFDMSFGVQRVLFKEWLGISSVRIGKTPSFSWSLLKNHGLNQWDFKIELSPKTFVTLIGKHNRKLESDFGFYTSLQLDVLNIVKFECGFNKLYENKITDKDLTNEIDIKHSFGIDVSLKQGISIKFGYKRGPSQINIPIKCTDNYSSLKQILLSFSVPLFTYYGYKLYYKKYSNKYKQKQIKKYLNEDGLSLYNKRQFALKQQSIMTNESNQNQKSEINKNGLIILCAYYGDHVEGKLFDAIRKYKNLDMELDDNEEEKEESKVDIIEMEEEEKHDEEEKKEYINITGTGQPPPLLFNIYPDNRNNREENLEKKKLKKIKLEDDKYKIRLCDIDWLGIENELDMLMRNNINEDRDLLSFINVRIVLQYMVNNNKSELVLTSGDKAYLPGFYDCCPDNGLAKELFVIYRYKQEYKYVTVSNVFPLTLPNDSHLEWFNCRTHGYC